MQKFKLDKKNIFEFIYFLELGEETTVLPMTTKSPATTSTPLSGGISKKFLKYIVIRDQKKYYYSSYAYFQIKVQSICFVDGIIVIGGEVYRRIKTSEVFYNGTTL